MISCCPACGNSFIGPEITNPEPATYAAGCCVRCIHTSNTINGIRHRMNQQPSASYIFVPREWLDLVLDVVEERSRPDFARLLTK